MGLTSRSTGLGAAQEMLSIKKQQETDRVIALAGNPNVGKSTVFNGLTGLKQHTGNWPGKTVTNAQGYCSHHGNGYILVDIPGTYSLMAHSQEEEVARDFLCFGEPDGVVVICDATCLERNLNLVLQSLEITNRVVVCVNLMDQAKSKGIHIDLDALARQLGVPVVATVAQKSRTLKNLMDAVEGIFTAPPTNTFSVVYAGSIEEALENLIPLVVQEVGYKLSPRWLSLRLLEGDTVLLHTASNYLGIDIEKNPVLQSAVFEQRKALLENGMDAEAFQDSLVSSIVYQAEGICSQVVSTSTADYNQRDRKIDRLLMSKRFGFPLMLLLLCFVFWLTITGANYPSAMLSNLLFGAEPHLLEFLSNIGVSAWLRDALVLGVYRVLAWVVSVMLPPMAIFFPLFTLLEDLGYLPRVAFNLDKCFHRCSACGKQALTMCMGFGCNAAGVVGCRIIDSPRERLIAIITNNFVPCNGRFPTLIAILTMFFISASTGFGASFLSALLLTSIILFGILMTFVTSKLLSKTILQGVPSSFTLELPPYRKPQIGKIIVHSIFDRTLFVLGRAVAVAAPAGLIIYIMANVQAGGIPLIQLCADFLDPFARAIGLDGVILFAFILGFPANEIVVPIIIMTYLSTGSLLELESLTALKVLLVDNDWTWVTAVCVMLFSLMHWPCSTTCLTIKKETQSIKWTVVSFLVPTCMGIGICFFVNTISKLFM